MTTYALGIDYGTLSARAVLVSTSDGHIAASAAADYPHGVMDRALPSGKALGRDWALQHPQDYVDVLCTIVPQALKEGGISGEQVVSIGVDFTCSTTLPCDAQGHALALDPEFADEPNAYVKLWKHHAEPQAAHILAIAQEMNLPWLSQSGGRVSAEWTLPKLLQLRQEAPALYACTSAYVEAGDWIVWLLTGQLTRSESYAAYKNFTLNGEYPGEDFFTAVHPDFAGITSTLLRGPVLPLTACAGHLTQEMAKKLSLVPGIPVAPGMTDSHTGVLAAGLCESGDVLSILGTSACHILQAQQDKTVTGIAGKVRGGILPGLTSYEANQSLGEVLAWYIDNACPARCAQEAQERGISIHQLMTEQASLLPPGGDGLIALDWFNGNRCILGDSQLSGLILGLTLRTRPAAIYRALMESTAYGMRAIIDNYAHQGLDVGRIVAMGGIAWKNPLMMQIIADVLGRDVLVSSAREGAAHGAAIASAAACGVFPSADAAVRAMSLPMEAVYHPGEQHEAYEKLYELFTRLHDTLGRDQKDIMHRLAALS